jgi:NADH-quinone oxidoreductase subunit C
VSDLTRSRALAGVVEGGIRYPGSAAPDAPTPVTPKNVPHRGGEANPSVAALHARFGDAIVRSAVVWGETSVVVQRAHFLEIVGFLQIDSTQRYDYLVDVTAVEFRDPDAPIEVIYHLRSLPFRRFLRVKVELAKSRTELWVPSLMPLYSGADWLERECHDMFGIRFEGHPDLRRILMWESYKEGYPLRKDFPLRGRFSRSEQLSQALAANPEAHYSMNELSIAEAFDDLPADMKARLARHEVVGE